MKKIIKKTFCALLSAASLSACMVIPASVNQLTGSAPFINSIVANASVNTNYSPYNTTGTVTANVAKMYRYDTKAKKFIAYPTANVLKNTPVEILGEKGEFYLVSYAQDGMWMKKCEIKKANRIRVYKVINPIIYSVSTYSGGHCDGNCCINLKIGDGEMLELDENGVCVRYYGRSGYAYIFGASISPVGYNFNNYIGRGLKAIN